MKNIIGRKEVVKFLGTEIVNIFEEQLPYKLPKCFPAWRRILESAALVINIANQPNKDDDFLIDYHAERWCVAITQKGTV